MFICVSKIAIYLIFISDCHIVFIFRLANLNLHFVNENLKSNSKIS